MTTQAARRDVAEVVQHWSAGHARGVVEGRAEGEADGEARALLVLLETRNLAVSPAQRERILSCRDCRTLDRWIRHAVGATSTEGLFETLGEARAVLTVIDMRSVDVTPAQRERILACSDRSTLETWLQNAVFARTADEVFEE